MAPSRIAGFAALRSSVMDPTVAPESPPVLHLVTIVFQAEFVPVKRISGPFQYYYFSLLGDHLRRGASFTDLDDHVFMENVESSMLADTQRRLFALIWVGGGGFPPPEYYFYALVLRKVGVYYERVGITTLADDSFTNLVQADGLDAAWRYIKLR